MKLLSVLGVIEISTVDEILEEDQENLCLTTNATFIYSIL